MDISITMSRQEYALYHSARELAEVITRIGPHGPWEFRGEDRLRTLLALDRLKDALAAYPKGTDDAR